MDQEEDFGLISVREALNSERIKLWLPPYYVDDNDTSDCLNVSFFCGNLLQFGGFWFSSGSG